VKNDAFIKKVLDIFANYKTVYMWGCFGQPVTDALVAEKTRQYPTFYTQGIQDKLRSLVGKGYFGFDCVNLIKAVAWGWSGDATKANGGAAYSTNGVQDVNADMMIKLCFKLTDDFKVIVPGCAVWMQGHIGVYIGDGKVVEATPSWDNRVQVTSLGNIGSVAGLHSRKWTMHGRLPFVEYEQKPGETGQASTLPPGGQASGQSPEVTKPDILPSDGYPADSDQPHWAEGFWKSLNDAGIRIHEKRFEDPIRRGELFALLDQVVNKK